MFGSIRRHVGQRVDFDPTTAAQRVVTFFLPTTDVPSHWREHNQVDYKKKQ